MCIAEQSGCDLSCLVSSVAQILLDPHYRTLAGFQALVQKEWVRMGHPFQSYLSLVARSEAELEQVLYTLTCTGTVHTNMYRIHQHTDIFLSQLKYIMYST